jgi:hypothetical protein
MRFAAPLVTAFSLINTAVTSVGTLTISGLNFGGTSYTSTISITAADACTSTAWTSSTLVACATSGRAQSTVQASVSVSGLVGTSINQFSFDGSSAWPAALVGNARPIFPPNRGFVYIMPRGCASAVCEHEQPAERGLLLWRVRHDQRPQLWQLGGHADVLPRRG